MLKLFKVIVQKWS